MGIYRSYPGNDPVARPGARANFGHVGDPDVKAKGGDRPDTVTAIMRGGIHGLPCVIPNYTPA